MTIWVGECEFPLPQDRISGQEKIIKSKAQF